MTSNDAPPAYVRTPSGYVRTVYDETFRAKSYFQPDIMSVADRPNLLGHLEHHSPQTDGSFAICIAAGNGVFISKDLLESIPAEHRPALDTAKAGQTVVMLAEDAMKSLGTTFFPVILTDAETGERMRIVLYSIVVPKLVMGMFIGRDVQFYKMESWAFRTATFTFDFGEGGEYKVKG